MGSTYFTTRRKNAKRFFHNSWKYICSSILVLPGGEVCGEGESREGAGKEGAGDGSQEGTGGGQFHFL